MKIREKEEGIGEETREKKRKMKGSKYGPLLKDLREFKKNKKGITGLIMLIIAIFLAVFAPVLILHSPLSHYSEDAYVHHPPTREYPLGTDVLGRDIYSQVIWGFRCALIISLPAAFLIGAIGTLVGVVSGFYGGIVDTALERVCAAFLVWPQIPLAALIIYSWGGYQFQIAVIMAAAFVLWPTTARTIRSEVKSLRTRTYIEAARVSGASSFRIISTHILPNIIHLTFLYMTMGVASALVLEAGIDFLGMGNPGVVSWGQLLSLTMTGRGAFAGWWTIVPPGLAIAYMVLSFFLMSSGWKEVVNPRMTESWF
ncbi:MAG: ABC transporter permease [Theionarchaea archaeon]|nr:ABC transporter permease [Theionarchaea archaeon]